MAGERRAIDEVMDRASHALVAMDYLACEALCEQALALAHAKRDWTYFARVVLPLQECRRQRRLIAAEGGIRLGTGDLAGDPKAWLERVTPGCIVVTHPHTVDDALTLLRAARDRRLHVEVLFADNPPDAATWKLRAVTGSAEDRGLGVDREAPPTECVDKWLTDPADARRQDAEAWFTAAGEALGDDLIAKAAAFPEGDRKRVDLLLAMTALAPDHEKLHQRLADAARAMRRDTLDGSGVVEEARDAGAGDPGLVADHKTRREGSRAGATAAAKATGGTRRRRRWPMVLLVLLGLLAAAAAWAWLKWSSTPAFWTRTQQTMGTLTAAQRQAIAASLEAKVTAALTKYDPTEDPDAPKDRTLEITTAEANAWVQERLPMWLANRGAALPPELSQPTVAVEDGRVVVAARVEAEGLAQVVSVWAKPALDASGMLRLSDVRVRGGELPLPAKGVIDRFGRHVPADRRPQVDAARQALSGAAVEAVFDPGDDRVVRFTDVDVMEDRVVLTFHHERKAKKK